MQPLGRRADPAYLRRDPAPSRWQYRMQRLWLTPVFRGLFRFGGPVVVIGLLGLAIFASDARRSAILQSFANLQQQFQQRPEFRVSLMSVEGASRDLSDAVRAKLALRLPMSSFDLDLAALRAAGQTRDLQARTALNRLAGLLDQIAARPEA